MGRLQHRPARLFAIVIQHLPIVTENGNDSGLGFLMGAEGAGACTDGRDGDNCDDECFNHGILPMGFRVALLPLGMLHR